MSASATQGGHNENCHCSRSLSPAFRMCTWPDTFRHLKTHYFQRISQSSLPAGAYLKWYKGIYTPTIVMHYISKGQDSKCDNRLNIQYIHGYS